MNSEKKYGFSKIEHLSSRKLIDTLFADGRAFSSECIKTIYLFTDQKLPARVQVLISVPKKQFKKAVERNLLKRRIREAYRLNKIPLIEKTVKEDKYLLIGFIYISPVLKQYSEIDSNMKLLLERLYS